jgi:hypothetical protein
MQSAKKLLKSVIIRDEVSVMGRFLLSVLILFKCVVGVAKFV